MEVIDSLFDEDKMNLIKLLQHNEINLHNETDYETQIFQNSQYFHNENFSDLLKLKTDAFTVVSLNCQSLYAKFEILKTYIEYYNDSQPKLCSICLQETWIGADSDLSLLQIPGYNLISIGKSCSAHGGVAMYLHKDFNYKIVNHGVRSNIWDGQVIEIVNDRTNEKYCKTITICNIYRPPVQTSENLSNFTKEINQIITRFENHEIFILTGDFNINLLKYQSNNAINDFLECMISNGLIPKITQPTRLSQNTGTLIDNIFVKIKKDIKTTAGILINKISDHLPYFLCLENFCYMNEKIKYVKVFPNYKISIENLKQELQSLQIQTKINNIFLKTNDINKKYTEFNNILNDLIKKHFQATSIKYNKYKHKKSKWITNAILKSIKYRDKMYASLKRNDLRNEQYQTLLVNFKTYNRILKSAMRQAKIMHYRNIFNHYKSDIKNTWKTINEILNRKKDKVQTPNYFTHNGQHLEDYKIIANEFNKYFTNVGPSYAANINAPSNKCYSDYLHKPVEKIFNFQNITEADVIATIEKLKSKTSKDKDNINNMLLKNIKHEIAKPLSIIMNMMFKEGIFPDELKVAKIIPIYKKNDMHCFENYRPISILPSISKVFERIIYNQIYEYFSISKLFYNSQYGFRSNHSTEHAAMELIDRIILDMEKKKSPINIFIDLSKAFDTINHNILLAKLEYYGITKKSIGLLNSYLKNRTQFVNYNNTISESLKLDCGVPQGSVLGPLLFIIYINDIVNATETLKPIIFADDITLITSIDCKNSKNIEKLNKELNSISDWLKLNKLSINVEKTQAIMFHNPQKKVQYPTLLIDGKKIEFVDKCNYLGIIIDQHLNWKNHIDAISKKISKVLGIMSKMKHTLPSEILLHIYNTLILSHLNYGLNIWGWKAERLLKLQKKAVRIITKSHFRSHTNGLFKKLNILKINDLCALQDYKFCYNLYHCKLPYYFLYDMKKPEIIQHTYRTRQATDIKLPALKYDFARHCITYKYHITIATIPDKFSEKIITHSIQGYKAYIKNSFLQAYNTECNIQNCYVCLI